MSLFDALKEKDNPYGIPLLTAGLSILANNRGDTAGAPAIFSGFKDGLSMYKTQNEQREKDQQKAMLRKLLGQYADGNEQQSTNPFAPPSAGGAVQSLSDFHARQASPALSAGAQGGLPMAGSQPQATAQQPDAYGANPQQNGQSSPNEHSMRELISKLAIAGMSPDNIHQMLPVLAKMTPDYQAQNLMVRGSDGQPQPLMVNSHGNTTMLPHNIAGKQHAVDLGGRSVMVDEYTGKPSAAFDKSVSPDAQLRANTAYGVAGLQNQNRLDVASMNNQASGKTNADDRLFRAVDAEVSRIEEAVKEGYKGTGVIADAATSIPFLGKHLRGFTDPRTQKVEGSSNALRGLMTKLVHGGRASNQDMEQVSKMLFMAANDPPEQREWAIKRLKVYLGDLEKRGPISESQQPASKSYIPEEEDIDFSGWYAE